MNAELVIHPSNIVPLERKRLVFKEREKGGLMTRESYCYRIILSTK